MPVIHNPYEKIVAINNLRRVQAGLLPINSANYTPDDPIPSPYASRPGAANTFLRLVPIGSGPAIEIYYDRIDLADLISMEVTKGVAVDIAGVIDQLSDSIGIESTVDDFENIPLPDSGSFTLTASLTNLAFLPSTFVEVTLTPMMEL